MAERICIVEGCANVLTARIRWCPKHYYRLRVHGSTDKPVRRDPKTSTCSEVDCTVRIDPARNKGGMCARCDRRRWYRDHREHELATMAVWRSRNPDRDRQRRAAYYATHRDEVRANAAARYHNDRERALAQAAAYRQANREAIRERAAARRRSDPNWPLRNRENSRRRHRGPDGMPVDYVAILAEHGMVCHICGGDIASMADLHMDHVIPLARGGAHHADNIRPAHARCNLRKGARIA